MLTSLFRNPARLTASLLTAAALTVMAPATALAQDAPSVITYSLFQGPTMLGEVGVALTRAADGTNSDSWVSVPGVLNLTDRLEAKADGSASYYFVEGVLQGIEFSIEATFDASGVDLTIVQAGSPVELRLDSVEPLYVIDNNFLDGIQVAVDHVLAADAAEHDLAIIVPQAATLGRMRFVRSAARESIEPIGSASEALRIEAVLAVGPQAIGMTIWVDEAGDILLLEQPLGSVRFVRRVPTSVAVTGDSAGTASDEDAAVASPASASALLAERSACVTEQELSVSSTGATLAGVLTLPVSAGTADALRGSPALLLLPGSGAVDLDGNAFPVVLNAGYRQLAYSLGCSGYAVLRIAKLGIPPSTGDGNAVTLQTYAQNSADWLARLGSVAGVDAARLGVMGHSEGGLVALYAAAEGLIDPAVIVLLASPGRGFDVLIEEQLLASALRAGTAAADLALLEGQIAEALAAIKQVEGASLELTGALAVNPIAGLFAHAAGLLRSEMEQDPARLIALATAPVLIVQGAKDLQVRKADGDALKAANPAATYLLLPDMAHNLYDVPGDAEAGLSPLPETVISDTLVRSLATYLHGHLRAAR